MNKFSTIIICLFILFIYSKLSAQTLYDPILGTGTVGGTTSAVGTSNGWTGHSGTGIINITSGSLTYLGSPAIPTSQGNRISIAGSNGSVSKDINEPTGLTSETTGYISALINVTDNTQLSPLYSADSYFFYFGGTAGSVVTLNGARLYIIKTASGSNYRLAIQNSALTTPSPTDYGVDLSFGTTYLIVIKLTLTSPMVATLWVNPTSLGGTEPGGGVSNSSSTYSLPALASVCIRNASNTPKADIDEIRVGTTWASVTPAASLVGPTKLAISNVNGGKSPSVGTPFSVMVQSQDNSNALSDVSLGTDFILNLGTGTGVLGGTLTGTIPPGQSSVTLTGVTYSNVEDGVSITVHRTGGDAPLSDGTSANFSVLTAADHLTLVNVPTFGLIAIKLTKFYVEARRSDNTVDLNYTGNITLNKVSGSGILSGTSTKAALAGIATFDDIQFNLADIYYISSIAIGLTPSTSGYIRIYSAPTVTENIVTQFCGSNIEGSRTAAMALITLSGLANGNSYDFRVAGSSGGIGSYAAYDATTGALLTPVAPMNSGGTYTANMFTASGTSQTLVIILIPSSNAAFASGSVINLHYWLTTNSISLLISDFPGAPITLLDYTTNAALLQGTSSYSAGEKFIFAWDNTSGTGRPLAGYISEDNGFTEPNYPTSYLNNNGSYGFLIPSTNSNGIQLLRAYGGGVSYPGIYSNEPLFYEGGYPGTKNPTAGTVVTINETNAPLPVELSSFTSNVNGRDVSLNWITNTEKNSDKFIIERKTNATAWGSIGTVKAAVLSNSPRQYSFSDKNLNAGKYQYRLKMVDNDGTFSYSKITEASVSTPKNFELSQNYPNPFNPSTKINYNLPSDAKVTLEVYNVLGVKVGQLVNEDQSSGYYSVDFNSSLNKNITSGVYLYKITAVDKVTGNSFSDTKKMMMLK